MNEKFDYKDSLTDIKASLFDIYEDQERVIGSIAPSLRDKHVSEFIEVKDLALSLLEKIQKLYDNSLVFEDNNIETNDEKLSDLEENDSTEDVDSDNSDINFDDEAVEKTTTDDQESDEADTSDLEEANSNKYYLLCDEGKLHFAYVSEKLFNKIKNYRDPGDNLLEADTDLDSSTFDGKIYKKDDLPVKGIIVRNDQYMKLALSKHRQEGVLKEAKNYRVETVRRKRQEQQKIELEKAKVHLDI